jgi:hypothetical protein
VEEMAAAATTATATKRAIVTAARQSQQRCIKQQRQQQWKGQLWQRQDKANNSASTMLKVFKASYSGIIIR